MLAKAITKSFAEAGTWISAHPQEAAQISVDKKYTAGDVKLNGDLLAQYQFISDPALAKASYMDYLKGMKQLNILDPATDVDTLVKNSFVDLSKS